MGIPNTEIGASKVSLVVWADTQARAITKIINPTEGFDSQRLRSQDSVMGNAVSALDNV